MCLFRITGYCGSCHRNKNPSGTSARYRGYRFSTSNYRKPDFCSHSCFTRTIGRFRHHSVRYSQDYRFPLPLPVFCRCVISMRVGKTVRRSRIPETSERRLFNDKKIKIKDVKNKRSAMISVIIFMLATAFIVLFGSFEGMRPSFLIDGEIVTLGCPPSSKSSCCRLPPSSYC